MEDVTMSFRVKKDIYDQMKMHDEINWSAVVRNAVKEKIKQRDHAGGEVNEARIREILNEAKKIRDSKVFDRGKSSTQIIREWRDKRK